MTDQLSDRQSVGAVSDVDVGAGDYTWYGTAECKERYLLTKQEVDEHFSFGAVRV